jgi:hypothetical protein
MWAARVAWALLPAVAGPSLAAGLESRSDAVTLVVAIALWLGWAVVLAGLFVPNSVTLTIVRIVVPASIVAVLLIGPHDGFDLGDGVALAASILVTALCFLPAVGAVFLHGLAYGDEERVALRAPGALLLGPIEISWVVLVAGASIGPLLLAAQQWIAGVVALVIGVLLVVVLARALHELARRWLVFVPAGVVVHDPLGLGDPVLLVRARVQSFGPALADSDATDLTMAAPGLALEIGLAQRTEMVQRLGRSGSRPLVTSALLVTPTRPGVAVAIAAERGVGQGGIGQWPVRGDRSPSP